MNEHTTISIVTPSFNQGRFIEETIMSVLSQEGDFYLDYIIMDGGSTDDSVELIKKYDILLKDDKWPVKCRGIKYRWVSEKDKGQTDAINKGFGIAEGEIANWLNSDDILLPGALGAVAAAFSTERDADIVYGNAYYTDEEGRVISEYPSGTFSYNGLSTSTPFCQPSVYYRLKSIRDIGFLDTGLQYAMDFDLWLKICKKGLVVRIPDFLATYRLHDTSKTVSDSHNAQMQQEILDIVRHYFGTAPINRVFALCYYRVRGALPQGLRESRPILLLLTFFYAAASYLYFNRGVRISDIGMIFERGVFRKLLFGWEARSQGKNNLI